MSPELEGMRPPSSDEFSLEDHHRWLLETWSFGHVLALALLCVVLSFGAAAAAMPSSPEDEGWFIAGGR